MRKRVLHTITEDYAAKYNLPVFYIGKTIVLYEDRISHIERHICDFSSIQSFDDSIFYMDEIIAKPEFISFNNKNNSLEFVKKIKDNVLVAVRVSNARELKVRTMYPITFERKSKLRNNSFENIK